LNKLPEVKKFLKEPGGIDQYANLKVNWIRGRTPELVIYDNGAQIEKISLESYTFGGLHKMAATKGFVKKTNLRH
jgi:hypothetical protein